ncbi:MAG: pyridoxamine 5'-phosphate oxidase family protein [Candidatus Omnitrophica bacterium]|nr:pyridoxamine 5'-phosphate oxidase family protein [Candidatus Omnitrophota bacterium]
MELDEQCREVIEKTKWISITTASESGPHTVAAWGYRLRKIGIQDGGTIVLPAGKYFQTEENLKKNSQIQLLMVSGDIQRADGKQGQGYRFIGKGEVRVEGPLVDLVRTEFPWARGALLIKIKKTEALIS